MIHKRSSSNDSIVYFKSDDINDESTPRHTIRISEIPFKTGLKDTGTLPVIPASKHREKLYI